MNIKKNFHTNLSDWIGIHLVRMAEENVVDPEKDPELHRRITKAEKNEDGDLIDPVFSFARRAEDLMPKRLGFSFKTLKTVLHRLLRISFALIVIVLCLFAVFYAIGSRSQMFDSQEVMLWGYAGLFLIQLFSLAVSVVVLAVFMLWQLPFLRRNNEPGDGRFAWIYGPVGCMLSWISVKLLDLPFFEKHRQEIPNQARFSEIGERGMEVLFSRTRPISMLFSFFTQFFWLFVSIVFYAAIFWAFVSDTHGFHLKTSWWDPDDPEDIRVFEQRIGFFGSPVKLVGGTVPSDEQIKNLFEGNTDNKTRKVWARFLTTLFFVTAVIPRFLLTLFCGGLFLFFRRDFKPDLKEPYFEDLKNRMEELVKPGESPEDRKRREKEEEEQRKREEAIRIAAEASKEAEPQATAAEPIKVDTEVRKPEPPEPAISEQENKNTLQTVLDATTSIRDCFGQIEASAVRSRSEQKAWTLACGCCVDKDVPEEIWNSLFSGSKAGVKTFPDLEESDDWLRENANMVQRFVVLIDTSQSMTGNVREHLVDVLRRIPQAELFAILSGGERLRKRYNNQENVAVHLADWRRKLKLAGFSEGRFIDFDHEHATDESKKLAREKLAGLETHFRLPGKFDRAAKLILSDADVVGKDDKPFWDRLTELNESINKLYASEFEAFQEILSKIELPSDVVDKATDALEQIHDAAKTGEKFVREEVKKSVEKLAGTSYWLWKNMPSLKTIGVTAAVGVGLAAAGTFLAVPGGAAALAVLPYAVGIGGGIGATAPFVRRYLPGLSDILPKNDKKSPKEPGTDHGDEIAELVRSSTVWALILEMQGLPEYVLVQHLDRLAGRLQKVSLGKEAERKRVLTEISNELNNVFTATK